MTKSDVIKSFTNLPGIGEAKAELLYDHGYTSLDKLKEATAQDLTKIQGFSEKTADELLKHVKKTTPEKPQKTTTKKPEKPAEKKSPKKQPATKKEEKQTEEEPVIIEDEEEPETSEYIVKKKPELTAEEQHQLRIRKQIKNRTPEFLREEWFRYKRIPQNWRRPDGITSKMRKNLKYRPSKVRVGFRSPRMVRGLHPSGFEEIIVHTTAELQHIDPKKQAIRIGGTVGTRKRLEIAKEAEKRDIRILNMRG